MDILRGLGNLAVLAVVSVVVAFFWWQAHPEQPFGTVWFVSGLLVWGAAVAFSGGAGRRKH